VPALKIALLSPYHTGSHRAWAEGFQRHSRHNVRIFALPGRFWKWRMHGGAVTLARDYNESGFNADIVLATDMLDVTTFLALTRRRTADLPVALYMHENQLTYPLPADGRTGPMRRQRGERDSHYVFVNFASMLAANRVFFNSLYHERALLDALPAFLKHFPDYPELQTVEEIAARCTVLPPGVDFARLLPAIPRPSSPLAPLIIWNQRWEYDKNPAAFLAALYVAADEGLLFRLALCGERFRREPAEFDEAISRLGERVVYVGFADQERYRQLLWEAAITLSTADHEFFGISIMEAIYCQTFPILPDRLSYPELIPERYHGYCLYANKLELLGKLRWALTSPDEVAAVARGLAGAVAAYDWTVMASRYDEALSSLAI
jgi:glycosyltransferase involved in cell wall biosynthesis